MTPDYLWLHLRALPYFRSLLRAEEARLFQDVSLPRPNLDVGCGDGHFASVALPGGVDVGVDPHLGSLREAGRRRCYRLLIQSDGARLPLEDNSLASAFSNSVLEHILQLDAVLAEVGRVLRPGAPLVFTVPNPGYRSQLSLPQALRHAGLRSLGEAYADWFMWMSRTKNLSYEDGWEERLRRAGFAVERTFRYFSPAALHVLEWGHYFGAPCLIPRWTVGRWILMPRRWNLWLTDRLIRRYYDPAPTEEGTYSFYLARKVNNAAR
jgi:SAM-dependent methyltransferase